MTEPEEGRYSISPRNKTGQSGVNRVHVGQQEAGSTKLCTPHSSNYYIVFNRNAKCGVRSAEFGWTWTSDEVYTVKDQYGLWSDGLWWNGTTAVYK